MKRLPRISDAEWLVMQVLWPSPGRTADEVVVALRGNPAAPGWSERTIRTLINRLLHKQALTYEREGRKYRYFPAVSQRQCVKQARRSSEAGEVAALLASRSAPYFLPSRITPRQAR